MFVDVFCKSRHVFCCVQMVEQGGHPVVAIKSARVGDFNGKTLGTISTSLVDVDPDVPEAGILRNWWVTQQKPHSFADCAL